MLGRAENTLQLLSLYSLGKKRKKEMYLLTIERNNCYIVIGAKLWENDNKTVGISLYAISFIYQPYSFL